jgi:hypothetical protein
MAKTVLPKVLIEEITRLHNQGFSSMGIFDAIQNEAQKYVESDRQLARCISAIGGKATSKTVAAQATPEKVKSIPLPRSFDATKYKDLISTLKEETDLKKIEEMFLPVVFDILKKEGFKDVQDVNRVPGFTNPPFDFFGFKKGEPYLIEFKGSLNYFHAPGETQKRRLQELRKKIDGLRIALLQVRLVKGEYRIFFDEEMDLFFDGPQMPSAPVEKWIRQQLQK